MPVKPSKIGKEAQRVWSHNIGMEGDIRKPGGAIEGLYKKSPAYYAGKALTPKKPKMPMITSPSPPPRAGGMEIEEQKRRQRALTKRRMGYASTLATRGGGYGLLSIKKQKALGA